MQNLPAYVQDSTDVINKIAVLQDLPPNTILATFESLYTHISHERGVTALEYYLQNHPDGINLSNTSSDIICSYQGEYYLQIKGTSMGSNFALSYANL